MLLEYNGYSKCGGIYQIKNKTNGTIYIGSTIKFYDRWTDHARSLKNNKHKTKHLQNAYSKYLLEQGNDDFIEFSILEVMENSTKLERLSREEWWIAKYLDEGAMLYNTNKTPTKEPKEHGLMSPEAKLQASRARKGKRLSPATEYKPGSIPWTKEHGHDEETRKLIGEKSKEMWANPESAEKLLKSRRSKKFRDNRSKNMRKAWEETRESRVAAMNTPELKTTKSINSKRVWSDPVLRQKLLESSQSDEARRKRLMSFIGKEKAEKIFDVEWLRSCVEELGYKGTAKLIGVGYETIKRWHQRLCM